MIASHVRCRSGEVNQSELIIDAIERFRLAKKEVSMGKKAPIEVRNDPAFGHAVEIDQNVATEDEIHALHKCHVSVVRKIESPKSHTLAHRRVYLQFVAGWYEMLLLIMQRNVTSAVSPISRIAGSRQGMLVQVGGENFHVPASRPLQLFLYDHAQCVGLFACGAPSAQHSQAPYRKRFFRSHDFGQDDLAQGIELRRTAEEAGFSDRDFVEQCDQFRLPRGSQSEMFEIFAETGGLYLFHPAGAAVEQKAQLSVGMKNASYLIDEIPDTNEFRVGRTIDRQE